MKKSSLLYIALACGAAATLQSCLDYDDPGAESSINQVATGTEIHQGRASVLNYRMEISGETARAAYNDRDFKIRLEQCNTGLYAMRGGKDGGTPEAHSYQFQYNLGTDAYAQYLIVSHKDFPYSNATLVSTYNYCERFNGGAHGGYGIAKNAFAPLINHPLADSIPELKAVYLLYYDLMAQENADLSGPFTYTEDKNNSEDPQIYEPMADIYSAIEADVDSIVNCFKYYEENRSEEYKSVVQQFFGSNVADGLGRELYSTKGFDNYIRLANSLKLRMAMHMAKVDPVTAQKWAEEAVSDGVVERVEHQQGLFTTIAGFTHPLVEIANSWNDTRISASFESLLMSLDHPYTKYFFKKNSSPIADIKNGTTIKKDSMLIGLRAGTRVGTGQSVASNPQLAYSSFDSEIMGFAPLYFISLSEVNFLRAEGALRGWNMGGDAEQFYYEGIKHSHLEDPQLQNYDYYQPEQTFAYYYDDYIALDHALPYTQHDPLSQSDDWESVTKIGVKWNDSDSKETKLEKIITQKYIGLFPNSQEAWTDLRRTGYPKLFPVLNAADGDGSIVQGDIIRRIPWASTDPVQQGYIKETGIPALGGDDFQATRLWWDVPGPNF